MTTPSNNKLEVSSLEKRLYVVIYTVWTALVWDIIRTFNIPSEFVTFTSLLCFGLSFNTFNLWISLVLVNFIREERTRDYHALYIRSRLAGVDSLQFLVVSLHKVITHNFAQYHFSD